MAWRPRSPPPRTGAMQLQGMWLPRSRAARSYFVLRTSYFHLADHPATPQRVHDDVLEGGGGADGEIGPGAAGAVGGEVGLPVGEAAPVAGQGGLVHGQFAGGAGLTIDQLQFAGQGGFEFVRREGVDDVRL